ncbi:MAG TPA: bifunctional diguanylate cyclase/phosphodiesterase [Ilumatobacter sp.]|nr:bifunctional diguanylate cyclase/phosphodiesterase [Ilumatobacter sp.]
MESPRVNSIRPELQVVFAACGCLVAAALCAYVIYQLGGSAEALRDGRWWAFVAAAVLFGLFEYIVFSWHVRREGMSFSLSEVPIALALVFLSPWLALVARLPFSLAVLVFARRNSYLKVLYNSSNYVFDLMFAVMLTRLLVRWWGTTDVAVIAASASALALVVPVDLVLTGFAISRFEGGFAKRVIVEFKASWWMFAVNAGIASMTVGLVVISPALGLIAVPPLAGVWFALWSYGKQGQRLRELDEVHGFSARVGQTLDVGEIGDAAVAEISRMLRAEGVALVRFNKGVAVESHVEGNVPIAIPAGTDQDGWPELLGPGQARLVPLDELKRRGIESSAAAIVATITDGDEPFAVLVVVERQEQANRFDSVDAVQVQNLVDQLATSLRRGMLHERLEYEARHDPLTDLPTRTLFEREVREVVKSPRPGVSCVMMLDLDRFKEVNDTLGHHAGDEVLVTLAGRLTSVLDPRDTLSRLAGDEFAVLCTRRTNEEISSFATECVRVAGAPMVIDELEIVVTASMGVAVILTSDTDAVQPMRRADIAMYNAKWQRSGVEFYRDEIDRRTPARLSMLGDLRAAIRGNQLDVVYQPKFDLGIGRVIGVEALVRWESPSRGVVQPQEFVRVAEDTGLIKELTDFVLSRGISDIAALHAAGIRTGLAVNLSTHDLFDVRLPQRVREYLAEWNLPASALTLEITESSLLVDAPRTRATIDALHSEGIRLAVDDFGTGYSSLSYLRRLPVDELKIDQSFVSGMPTNPHDEVIVRSTVDLGHNLGLRVVAEGVESLIALDQLRDVGCDVVQGYAISPPIRSESLAGWLIEIDNAITHGRPLPWSSVHN